MFLELENFIMLRKNFLAATLCGLVLSFATVANASVCFSQAELLGMTINVVNSNGFTGSGLLTANPTYGDGQPGMSGEAGATGDLNPFIPGGVAVAYYGLNAADLALFNLAVAGGETLQMIGYNDNNQPWELGIWYQIGLVISEDSAVTAAGASAGLSLPVPGAVVAAGVYVRNVLSPVSADNFHASFSCVPEPTSFLVWGAFALAGIAGLRRNRDLA